MSKYLLLITFSLIFSFGFNSNESTRKSYSLNVIPIITPPEQSGTEKLVLDKDNICRPCPPGHRPTEVSDCDDNMAITVSVGKAENENLKYEYTISGGRIIGEGSRVIWDMTGVESGNYQIRVDIEDKSKGQTQSDTKTIKVVEYACCLPVCVCPTISVNAPTSLTKVGETMIFTADVRGGVEDITYNWTVSDGEIIEGQGTPVIKVSTDSKIAGKTVKATVEIGGVCQDCNKTESGSGSVADAKLDKK